MSDPQTTKSSGLAEVEFIIRITCTSDEVRRMRNGIDELMARFPGRPATWSSGAPGSESNAG